MQGASRGMREGRDAGCARACCDWHGLQLPRVPQPTESCGARPPGCLPPSPFPFVGFPFGSGELPVLVPPG